MPTTLLFDYPTTEELSRYLLDCLFPGKDVPASSIEAVSRYHDADTEMIEDLSEEDAERMLMEELPGIGEGVNE